MFPLHPINSYVYVNSKDIIGRQNLVILHLLVLSNRDPYEYD